MSKNFEQLVEEAKQVKLNPEEKQKIRGQVLHFIETHPVRMSLPQRHIFQNESTGRSSILALLVSLRPFQTMTLALIIAMMIGGGVSMAAEGAMPGDTLYPVKVEVNERVLAWAAMTSEADADWGARRAERRLEEVEKLVSIGRLDAETSAVIESNFEAHANDAEAYIAALQTNNKIEAAADVSSRLETSLSAHRRILEQASEENVEVGANVKGLLDNIRATASTAAKVRSATESELAGITAHTDAAANIRLRASAESRQKIAEASLADIREYLNSSSTSLDAESNLKVETQMKIAEQALQEGNEFLKTETYGKAFAAFQKSVRIAEEARLLVRARQTLKISVDLGADNGDGDNAGTAIMMSADTSASATTATSTHSTTATTTSATSSSKNVNSSSTIQIGL